MDWSIARGQTNGKGEVTLKSEVLSHMMHSNRPQYHKLTAIYDYVSQQENEMKKSCCYENISDVTMFMISMYEETHLESSH